MANRITLKLRPEARAPAVARRVLDQIEDVDPAALATARLLVSELVTNSFRHGRLREADRIEVRVRTDRDRLHVEVSDPGCGFKPSIHRGTSERTAESGWGLRIVDRLADRWGVMNEDGTVVWFDIEGRSGWTATN